MKKLFTKTFLAASLPDQQKIITSILNDLERAAGYDETRLVKAIIHRIKRKAIQYGIFGASELK